MRPRTMVCGRYPPPIRWSGGVKDLQSQKALNSPADEHRPSRNRRQGERHMTLFRVGSLLVGTRRSLCVVKNISCGGASIRAYCDLDEGQVVSLELKEQEPIDAKVTWVSGTDTGLEFANKIDVLSLLKVERDGIRPRMPRVEVGADGSIRQGALIHRLVVNNISQGGIRAQCGAELAVGGEVTVTLPGLAPVQGVVRWGCSDVYGITFNTVLGLPLLVDWLRTRMPAQAALS